MTVIKRMTMDDYEDAYALWSGTPGMGMRSLDDSRKGIEKFLKRNPQTCFVCRDEEILAGIILCGHDGRRGYIYHAAVHEKYRRRGIGRDLVNGAIKSLEKEGIKKAALVVYADNQLGNGFWESLGFTERKDITYRNRVIDERNL